MAHAPSIGAARRQERHFGRAQAFAHQIRNEVEQRNVAAEASTPLVERALPGQRQTINGQDAGPLGLGSSSSARTGSVNDPVSSSVDIRTTISRVSTKSTTSSRQTTAAASSSTSSSSQRAETTSSTRSTSSSSASSSANIATRTVAPSSSSSSLPALTSVAVVTSSAVSANNAAASNTSSGESNKLGAGPIVGIVAGSLAGLAIIAVIVGFLIKKLRRKEDPYEANPFDREEFRRQSIMLDDGQGGDAGYGYHEYQPPMSEMHQGGSYGGMHQGGFAGYDEYGNMAAAGAAGAAGGYALSQDEHGRPRPPTMFQRHLEHQASFNTAYEVPPTPVRMRSDGDMPQLPEAALGGSDPYSLAGVGRQGGEENINNPYGYLDRRSPLPRKTPDYGSIDGYAAAGMHGAGNGGSPPQDYPMRGGSMHDTAGRPGTSEGRSGTPDLPNLQQTYAMGGVVPSGSAGSNLQFQHGSSGHGPIGGAAHGGDHQYGDGRSSSVDRNMMTSPAPMYDAPSEMSGAHQAPQQSSLQVRNYLDARRPLSTATEGDENAAYGGVW